MTEKGSYVYIAEGVFRGFILTLIAILIYSAIIRFHTFSSAVTNTTLMVITLVSIVYAAIFAVKKINKRGWLVGLLIAVIYFAIVYLVALFAGGERSFTMDNLIKFGLAMGVGALSGMLGINL